MNDEDFMNIVEDVFEEMDVNNIVEEKMSGQSDEDGPLSDDRQNFRQFTDQRIKW